MPPAATKTARGVGSSITIFECFRRSTSHPSSCRSCGAPSVVPRCCVTATTAGHRTPRKTDAQVTSGRRASSPLPMPDIGYITISWRHSCKSFRTFWVRPEMRVSAKACVLLLALLESACGSSGVLDPHGPIGGAERTILFDATVIMLAVVVPVILATGVFAWWFRAGNRKARRDLDWEHAGRIEFVVWAIPALVVLFLGGICWISSHDLDPRTRLHASSAPVEVEVVALDWKW